MKDLLSGTLLNREVLHNLQEEVVGGLRHAICNSRNAHRGIFIWRLSTHSAKGIDGRVCLNKPHICKTAQRSEEGRKICRAVIEMLKNITDALGTDLRPFVFCCKIGAKILVVPTEDETYLAICRSPDFHKNHVEDSARLCHVKFSDMRDGWYKLRQFGPQFIKDVLQALQPYGVEITDDLKESLESLGNSYGAYGFDIVIYNTLREIWKRNGKDSIGTEIRYASRPQKRTIVRVIFQDITSFEKAPSIPIVGLLTEKNQNDFKKDLHSSLIKNLTQEVMKTWIQESEPVKIVESWPKKEGKYPSENGQWEANGNFFFPKNIDDNVKNKWIKENEPWIKTGLHCGSDTICDLLITYLYENDFENFQKKLKEQIDEFSSLHETPSGKRETWYRLVFRDLDYVICADTEFAKNGKETIERLLKFIKPYARIELPLDFREEPKLRSSLIHDMLNNGDEYRRIIGKKIIKYKLKIFHYSRDTVRDCLASYPETTLKDLLIATKNKDISIKDEIGRNAWAEVLDFCDNYESKELSEKIRERLYELTANRAQWFLLGIRADLSGLFWKVITFGIVLSYPIINNIRRKAYEKHLRKLFKFHTQSVEKLHF